LLPLSELEQISHHLLVNKTWNKKWLHLCSSVLGFVLRLNIFDTKTPQLIGPRVQNFFCPHFLGHFPFANPLPPHHGPTPLSALLAFFLAKKGWAQWRGGFGSLPNWNSENHTKQLPWVAVVGRWSAHQTPK